MKTLRFFGGFICFYWFGMYGRTKSGRGISIKYSTMRPLFSERNGYRKVYKLGNFKLEVLKP